MLGTMLGAIRHGGFIPWMMILIGNARKTKNFESCRDELPSHLQIGNYKIPIISILYYKGSRYNVKVLRTYH